MTFIRKLARDPAVTWPFGIRDEHTVTTRTRRQFP